MSYILSVFFSAFIITSMDFFLKCTHCELEFQDENAFATHAKVTKSHGINVGTTTNPCHPRLICRKCHRSYDEKKGFQGKGMHLLYQDRACLQWHISKSDFGRVSGSSVFFHHLIGARFCHVLFDCFLISLIRRDSWMYDWLIVRPRLHYFVRYRVRLLWSEWESNRSSAKKSLNHSIF